jgi:class I fructose-bisphosphate aldolase
MKELHLRHLMGTDGRMVIIAFDHAGFMGPLPGLENPGSLLDQVASSGVDAVLTTIGVVRRYATRFGKLGIILRVDGGSTARCPVSGEINKLFSIEEAVRLGVDAVACMGMIGFPDERSSLNNLARLSAETEEWGLPILAEMLVKARDNQEVTAEDIRFAMRIGAEMGADLIKSPFAGPVERYREAVQQCYRPVVVLGGSKVDSEASLLESIQEALDSGASGVAIGRNVWQHKNPAGICRALVALVHGNASIAQALKEIEA